MHDDDQELNNLSLETVEKAIAAVKARAWDVNPFTVADELKVSRAAIYRHAEIMKLIIAARGGSFGMDVQTSLDLTWQLRQLEQQNIELKEKLATSGSQVPLNVVLEPVNEPQETVVFDDEPTDKASEVSFNLASDGNRMSHYFNQLANLAWKDLETVYYFKVASLKDHAKNLFKTEDKPQGTNGDNTADSINKSAISYGSLSKLETSKREKQSSFTSPFARLKSGASQIKRDVDPKQKTKELAPRPELESVILQPEIPVKQDIAVEPKISEIKVEAAKEELVVEAIDVVLSDVLAQSDLEAAEQLEKIETDALQTVSDLQKELASKIRASLSSEVSNVDVSEAEVSNIKEEIPSSDGWFDFENEIPSVEVDGWKNFEAEKLGTGSFSWSGVEEPKIAPIEPVIEPSPKEEPPLQDIKLISLGKENLISEESVVSEQTSIIQQENVIFEEESIIQQENIDKETDTGEMSIIGDQGTVKGSPISSDELRDLIQSHIKNAAEQMADSHSIGSGKEYEVWLNNPARSKFVGSTKTPEAGGIEEEESKASPKKPPFKPRVVPPEVRKACLILGVRPDNITFEAVQEAWKKAIAAPGVHPDQGGDTELAVYLNTAKDVLMRFLDAQAPKLGKKFGPFKAENDAKPKVEKPKDKQ